MLVALDLVLKRRGRFGCNLRFLLEMGEELGSPGLRRFAAEKRDLLKADLLLASDGPRWRRAHPSIILGARGHLQFQLVCNPRAVDLHSGNWGGLAANPGTLVAHAITALVDARGEPTAEPLRARSMPTAIRDHLRSIPAPDAVPGVVIAENWGTFGTPAERVLGFGGIEILAYSTGDIVAPQSAIPPIAKAIVAYNFTVDYDPAGWQARIQDFLDARGLGAVKVLPTNIPVMGATRTDPTLPVVTWARDRLARATGKDVDVLPNMGGALPNDIFADDLGMTTLWVPHSYSGSQQHGGDEHVLRAIMAEGLHGMAALVSDLGNAVRTS
jgi:acetylornithine deacetylase/succinyl-diaminopimelate desuccinylase-like protein